MVGALPRAWHLAGSQRLITLESGAAKLQEPTSARAKPRKVNILPKPPYAKQYFIAKPKRFFFGFTIVRDYLATVNALLVRTLEIYPGCGMYGGYTCELTCVHIHRHVDMCVYCVEVCTYIHTHAFICVHVSTCVDVAVQCWHSDLGRLQHAA